MSPLPAPDRAGAVRRSLHLLLRRLPGLSHLPARVRRRVLVSGRVQGVWFRESCREQAVAAGVAGSVRNRDDGRVEAVLEGSPPAVERVVAWCREGPRRARVDAVEVAEEPLVGESGFRVR